MGKWLMAAMMAAGLGLFVTPSVAAVPPLGVIALDQAVNLVNEPAAQQEARVYCRRGSVFLHWGPCAHDRGRYYRPAYRPVYRVYRPAYRVYRPVYRGYGGGYRRY